MNLADAQALALLHMEAHGLLQQGWVFKFDVRATRRFGQCRVVKRRFDSLVLSRTLSLSAPLTRLNAEKEVEDTILHEVAHALAGLDADHGPAWKACASRLGARPEACYRPKEHGVKVPYKWEAFCPGCHEVRQQAMRPPKRVQSCKKCSGGRYNPEFKLLWRYAPEGVSGAYATI